MEEEAKHHQVCPRLHNISQRLQWAEIQHGGKTEFNSWIDFFSCRYDFSMDMKMVPEAYLHFHIS